MLFMCSARARRCRAQCDVLFIPQLVAILPRIFCRFFVLLLLLVVVAVVAAAPAAFFSISSWQKSTNTWCFCVFEILGEKITVNTKMLFAPRKFKTTIFAILVAKITVFTLFLASATVSSMLQEVFVP